MTASSVRTTSRPGASQDSGDANTAHAIAGFGILIMIVLGGISHYLDRDTANRVSIETMQYSAPMTDALRRAGEQLPANVSALHCWFKHPDTEGDRTWATVLCDATLQGRSVNEMDETGDRWTDTIYANPNEPGHPTHGFERDTRDMIDSEFNFVIRRGKSGLDVLSDVDPQRLTFAEASGVTNAVAHVFNGTEQYRLDVAQANSPDTVKASWPMAASSK